MESAIVVAIIIGLLPASIARSKGHSFFGWWLLGAMMFIVALPCSFFLKNKTGKQCPDCTEYVDLNARICKHCRFKFI